MSSFFNSLSISVIYKCHFWNIPILYLFKCHNLICVIVWATPEEVRIKGPTVITILWENLVASWIKLPIIRIFILVSKWDSLTLARNIFFIVSGFLLRSYNLTILRYFYCRISRQSFNHDFFFQIGTHKWDFFHASVSFCYTKSRLLLLLKLGGLENVYWMGFYLYAVLDTCSTTLQFGLEPSWGICLFFIARNAWSGLLCSHLWTQNS